MDMNATGFGPQDLRSEEGGNSTRGMLDQVRPTGIVATGGGYRGGERKSMRKAMRVKGRRK